MFVTSQRTELGIFKIIKVYYATDIQYEHQGVDLACYYHCQKPLGLFIREFKTLIIDLDRDPEEILRSFHKKTRIQIEKALASNKIDFNIIENPSEKELNVFYNSYISFSARKGFMPSSRQHLEELKSADKLLIASASTENETLCRFALIKLTNKVVCSHAFNIRFSCLDDTEKVKLISQANRALDYHCMLYAKKIGKTIYDLGGLTLDPNNPSSANVDQYKMKFKGQMIKEYHFMKPLTLKGWLACFMIQLKRYFINPYFFSP